MDRNLDKGNHRAKGGCLGMVLAVAAVLALMPFAGMAYGLVVR